MNPSEQSRRLMEVERRQNRLELKLVAIAAQNEKIITMLTALGGGLTSNVVVRN
jgi:hypothetical protein